MGRLKPRVDITVDPDIHEEFRLIMQKQGSSVSADIQRYELSIVDEYKKTQFMTTPIGVLGVKDNGKQHVPPTVINETLDKWMADAKLKLEDGTIEELKGVSKKALSYNTLINSLIWTHKSKVDKSREDEMMLSRTTQYREMQKLRQENALLKRRQKQSVQYITTTTSNDDNEEVVQDEEVVT